MTVETPVHFGQTLRTLRTSANLSLRELSRRIGVTAGYLSQVESGRLPPPSDTRIAQIADELGLTAEHLLRLSGRLDTELIEFLAGNPELVRLVELVRQSELSSGFLQQLHHVISEFGEQALDKIQSPPSKPKSLLNQLLLQQNTFAKLERRSRKTIFEFLTQQLVKSTTSGLEISTESVLEKLAQREARGPTLIGQNIVLPHACVPGLTQPRLAFATLARAVTWATGHKVQLVFLVLYSPEQNDKRIELLAEIASQVSDAERVKTLLKATTSTELWKNLTSD